MFDMYVEFNSEPIDKIEVKISAMKCHGELQAKLEWMIDFLDFYELEIIDNLPVIHDDYLGKKRHIQFTRQTLEIILHCLFDNKEKHEKRQG